MPKIKSKDFKPFLVYLALPFLLGACSSSGQAPDFLILNSFFPSWLISALIATVITVLLRVLLIKLDIDEHLPFRFFVYVALWLTMSIVLTYIYSPR